MKRFMLAAALLFAAASARSEEGWLKGFYAGLALPYHSLGGDFDGTKILMDSVETYYVPKVDPAPAYGIVAGYRGRITESQQKAIDGALEVTFAAGKHGASFNGKSYDAYYSQLDFDLKAFFRADKRFQPYGGIGLSFSWLTAKGLVATLAETGDAVYSGMSLNLSAGAGYFVSKNVMLDLGLTCRAGGFSAAKGVANEVKGIDNALDPKMIYPALKLDYLF